jgi:quercetin dioxygenase-like cupin family protein
MSDDTIDNPVTGERIVFRVGMGDPSAPVLGFDFFVRPGGGVFVPHFHRGQSETLRVITGRMRCGLPGAEREVGPGQSVTFAPGEGHALASVGAEELHAYVEFRPAGRAESFLRNYFGLCRDGQSDAKGELKLTQVAVLMPAHGTWRADIPVLAQRVLFTLLRPISWMRGRRASYPRYTA